MERRFVRRAVCAPLFFLSLPAAEAQVLISELYYDAPGSDAGQVFVELIGTPGTDLGGYQLQGINGGNGSSYLSVTLSGSIGADGVFVIADDSGDGTTLVSGADLIADVDLQNGPDSLQLLDSGGNLLDAVGYGDFSSAIFAGEGMPAPDVPAGSSLARLGWADSDDNLSDFSVLASPTPGIAASPVPLPGAFWLFGSGLLGLAGIRRRTD